jgi:hypothetical protein
VAQLVETGGQGLALLGAQVIDVVIATAAATTATAVRWPPSGGGRGRRALDAMLTFRCPEAAHAW